MWLPRTITSAARKTLMALPFCAGAAGARAGVLDAVVGDQAAVVALVALPDADAAVAGLGDDVGGDEQAAAVVAEQRVVGRAGDRVECVTSPSQLSSVTPLPPAPAIVAIGDADGFHVVEVHQSAAVRAASGRRRRA